MADLNLNTAEELNVTAPVGHLIDVEMALTSDIGIPVDITGVWEGVIMKGKTTLLTLTAGTGFSIATNVLTLHFGYILARLNPDEYKWKMKKTEDNFSEPIWEGSLTVLP